MITRHARVWLVLLVCVGSTVSAETATPRSGEKPLGIQTVSPPPLKNQPTVCR
jgi:hypothetical protein